MGSGNEIGRKRVLFSILLRWFLDFRAFFVPRLLSLLNGDVTNPSPNEKSADQKARGLWERDCVRLDSEHAQSDGKSVNRGLPVLDMARGPEPGRAKEESWPRLFESRLK